MDLLNKFLMKTSRPILQRCCAMIKMDANNFKNNVIAHSLPTLSPNISKILKCKDPNAINFAVHMLVSGEVVALPTDTVYGLACSANNSLALQNLYNVKGRSETKPVAICVSEVGEIRKWGEAGHLCDELLNALLPGPVTLILYKTKNLNNPFLNPGVDKIGIRIPDFKFIREIAKLCDFPLALTSANLSNEPSSLSVEEFSCIWNKIPAIFDGGYISNDANRRAASTVIDLSEKGFYAITREGIALNETEAILRKYGVCKQ